MTEYQLQKLTECCICFKTFTDPRMLPCIHTFCLECLEQTGKAAKKEPREDMPCPLCRKMFAIPAEGVNRLQKNFFMQHLLQVSTSLQLTNVSTIACDICKDLYEGQEKTKPAMMRCLECRDNFCDICAKAHTLHKSSKFHYVVKIGSETEEDLRRISPTRICIEHSQKPLDYYCPQCKKIVCVSCVLEKHVSHECKDVTTVEDEFRQVIERNASKISTCADEVLPKRKRVQKRKDNILLKLAEIESEIRSRNLKLKQIIDSHTKSLMEELSLIKQKHIKVYESEMEEIESVHTILKSFESYCTELRSKGSASDICSCVDELSKRSNEMEVDHETFIGRSSQSTEVSFTVTDFGEILNTSNMNIVGRIQETFSQTENCMVIAGLNDGQNSMNDVFKINLQRPEDVSTQQQIPTKMQNEAAAAVYCDTMYVTGIGVYYNEIWKYNMASGWMKCASLVKGRRRHSAAFIDEVLYICGGFVDSDGSVLDSVEAYNAVTDKCFTSGKLVHCAQNSGNCVPFQSSLYLFGGTDKDYKVFNHVQVYNTKLNMCTLLSKPMPRSYNMLRAVLWETSVILLGCDVCFIFNFETETWQERKQFKTDVIHFGLALENGRIFVIGGGMTTKTEAGKETWICRGDMRYVPLKSIIDNKPADWRNYTKLANPVLVQTYAKVTFSCQ